MTDMGLPSPVAAACAGLFAVVALVHLGHAVVMGGRHRAWHAGHVLMAVAMTVMCLPVVTPMTTTPLGTAVLAVAAAGLAAGLVVARLRGAHVGPLWAVSVVDLAATAAMIDMSSPVPVWVGVLGTGWFALQAVGWATGRLGRVLEHRGLGDPVPPTHAARPPAAPGGPAPAGVLAPVRVGRVVDGGRYDVSIRATLTVMAVGMAAMFLAAALGPPAPMGMPGM